MPCANPVARSCVKSAANAVDAIAGLSRPPGSLIYSDFMGGLGGAGPLLGYSLLGGQYQDGVLVGLRPACDDLSFAGLPGVRGMRTMGQITNLLANSVFDGAVSGNPGTPPTGWGTFSSGVTNRLVVGSAIKYTATTGRIFDTPPAVTLAANTVYDMTMDVVFDGVLDISFIFSVTPPSGSTQIYVNGVLASGVQPAGNARVRIVISVGATGGLYSPRMGAGSSVTATGHVTISNPMITTSISIGANYVPTTPAGPVTQTSTAHNGTSGIHYNMPQNGAVWNQLSTAKPLTLAARIVTGVGSAEIPNSTTLNIRTCRSDPSRLLRVVKDSSGNCRVELHDGTNTAQSPIITWSRYQQLIVVGQVLNGGLQMRAGAKVGAGALSFGSAVTYAGSFGPDAVYSKLMLAHSNVYPVHTLKDWLADYQSSEADILAAMGVA